MNAMPPIPTVVLATRNAHKVLEIRALLGQASSCLTLNDFSEAPDVVEDAGSFAGNATKKAVELAWWLACLPKTEGAGRSLLVLADDSGLEVDALNGAPGVFSARFSAPDGSGNAPDADNNAKLLRLLQGVPSASRTARFRCVIALTRVPDFFGGAAGKRMGDLQAVTRVFEGVCEGRIEAAARGQGGFGYDPLFVPDGFEQCFAELGGEVKNRISHRARALEKLRVAGV